MKTPDLKTICFEALDDLKAQNILVLDIRDISGFADWFIIATASSSRNAKAISNKLIESLKLQQHQLVGVEGQDDSEWILVDCGDVVVNIMQKETREFYDLESLWGEKTLVLDIRDISGFADWFIIATASSSRNAKAISNKLIESLKLQQHQLVGVEGQDDSEWILVDCGDVVVNIMQKETREFYDLESLWGEKTLVSA